MAEREIELKIVLDGAAERGLRERVVARGAEGGRTQALRSVYYDTAAQDLRRAGIALRLRKVGRVWVQTVKARAALSGGLSTALEAEAPAPGGRLDLERIPDAGLRDEVVRAVGGAALAPLFETEMKRTTWRLGDVELALDVGEIRAGERARPFREAELELVAGGVAALYDLAEALFPEGGLRLSTLSKAARGHLLAETGEIAPPSGPQRAGDVPLERGQTAETAARDVLRDCAAQIGANAVAVLEGEDPEGPHQLRVGLRRLRSALQVFRPAIGGAAADAIAAEARWLGQEVGRLRDLDVVLGEILAPEAALCPEEPGFARLAEAVAARREAVRETLREELRGARAQAFQWRLARFVETRGWLAPDDYAQTARLAQHVGLAAGPALDKRWAAVTKRAKGLAGLDVPARHELRKELKKLRYAAEFLAPLYPPKRVAKFLKATKALQEVFGNLNDLAAAEHLLTGATAPAAEDPAAARAVGRVLGRRAVAAERDWERAVGLWSALGKAEPFWC